MKVLDPSPLMREAADALADVHAEVVVIGAVALEAALAGHDARSAATADVDGAVTVSSAAGVIAHLETTGFQPSGEPHERGFTWVRGDLKIQLVRPPARVAPPEAKRLVPNTHFSLAANYRETLAFTESSERARLVVARPAAVLALKGHAFGRTRPSGETVERDYHDAYLLISHVAGEIAAEYHATDDGELRSLIRRAVEDLQSPPARQAVRNQATQLDPGMSEREADVSLTRALKAFERRLRRRSA